jgi:hypothetical protein
VTPMEWTQRYGFNYPESIFERALRATFYLIDNLEVEACASEATRLRSEWLHTGVDPAKAAA